MNESPLLGQHPVYIHCRSFILIYISAVHIINFQSYCITFSNEFLEDKKKTTGRRAWTSKKIDYVYSTYVDEDERPAVDVHRMLAQSCILNLK
jgi:hypothetical protein